MASYEEQHKESCGDINIVISLHNNASAKSGLHLALRRLLKPLSLVITRANE